MNKKIIQIVAIIALVAMLLTLLPVFVNATENPSEATNPSIAPNPSQPSAPPESSVPPTTVDDSLTVGGAKADYDSGVVMVYAPELEETMKCIHKILNEGLPLLETGEVIPTPCSIGIVMGQKEGLEYSYVIEQADKAMYHAKEKGKNTYHILKM